MQQQAQPLNPLHKTLKLAPHPHHEAGTRIEAPDPADVGILEAEGTPEGVEAGAATIPKGIGAQEADPAAETDLTAVLEGQRVPTP